MKPAENPHPELGEGPIHGFRAAFFPVWRIAAPIMSLLFSGTAVLFLFIMMGAVPIWLCLWISVCTGIMTAALLAHGIAEAQVYVSERGLKCRDGWDAYYTVAWQDITEVLPINVGLRYLRVRSPKLPRDLWLPAFLADMRGFARIVQALAGPEHPLLPHLEKYLD